VARGTDTRQRLIETGLTLFATQGYAATGVGQVTRAADVPKGSFYHYFSSKEDFARAVVEAYARAGADGRAALRDGPGPPLERVRAHFEGFARQFEAEIAAGRPFAGCLIGNLAQEAAEHHGGLRRGLASALEGWRVDVTEALREARASGELPGSTAPADLAACLVDAWEGALLVAKASADAAPMRRFLTITLPRLLGDASQS